MHNTRKLIVSHAPFWHAGSSITARSCHIMGAAMLAVIPGIAQYGVPAVAVVCLAISSAMIWELLFSVIAKRPVAIADGNAAMIGMIFAMLVPATTPWWAVLTGTFVAVIIGKQIYGGIGGNPFNPVLIGIAILSLSWKDYFDFTEALLVYDFDFPAIYPLAALKAFGTGAISSFTPLDLFLGRQIGGIGATCGLALMVGGVYLILRGFIRWEISVSFLAGVFLSALLFQFFGEPGRYAGPLFHLLTGYTLIGAFFLATEDSSSPVYFYPMLIYGAAAGVMTVMIRNIGAYADGVVYAILLLNLVNPIIDKIRPKAIGKVI
ncbi:MAG: RnfABCDGE type electron transport complex subunit D [Thermodesulfobacteriota bacterium]